MIPGLIAFAFALALQAQTMESPLAAAWLFPLLLACVMSIYKNGAERSRGGMWWAGLAWLLALFFHTFFMRPVPGAASVLWILAAPSIIMLTIQPRHLMPTIKWVGFVLVLYALGLVAQELLQVRYTSGLEAHSGRSWPIIDPNNAAAILNFGLLATAAAALYRRWWLAPASLFGVTLLMTNSNAGIGAAIISFGFILLALAGKRFIFFFSGLCSFGYIALHYAMPHDVARAISSMLDRLPIWEASLRLLSWPGLGLGSFGFYYQQIRTEMNSAGFYAHNNLLQIAVEGGALLTIIVLAFGRQVFVTSSRRNIVPAAMLLMVTIQAMVEFQFYVPAIAMLTGLALAWHRYAKLHFTRQGSMMVFDTLHHA